MSDDPDDDRRPGVTWVPALVDIWAGDGRRPPRRRILAELTRQWLRADRTHPSFTWSDVCVSAGGRYLYDDGTWSSRLNLLLRLLPLRTARAAGVPLVLFSQSVGPFASSSMARLVGRELRRARLVIVREAVSEEVCRELGVTRLALCDDVAFALRPPTASAPVADRGDRPRAGVGVTVMNALPGVDEAGYRRYRDALLHGLVAALSERDAEAVIVSQVAAQADDSDVTAASELAADLVRAGVTARFVDLGDASDEALVEFYGHLTLVVASRLHSGILALCAGTPILALSYLPKTDGVLARLGWTELVQQAAGLDADALAAGIHTALDRHDALAADLQARLPVLRRSAESAADLTLEAARAA